MLFYSYPFLFVFLPIALIGFFFVAKLSHRLAAGWLALASLIFYGYWNPKFVILILVSIGFNYAIGYRLARGTRNGSGKALLAFAVIVNLTVLGYFKYSNFFVATIDALGGVHWALTDIALPLGISIFTFTQIAFLCDVYRGVAAEYNFVHYVLFVTYFPHMVAGPIIHHAQIMPYFGAPGTYRVRAENIAEGAIIFTIGLAKKVLLAVSFAEYADPIFDGVDQGIQPDLYVAWLGVFSYTLQIYFDFSGYTDMAIGLSRVFGIPLPESFNSPYKACNIIDFWRRWNITLSHFLRDYLYVPLGGNRKGTTRRYANLILTMLLGGLWHGANWTFVAWGALHGIYLIANHAWISFKKRLGLVARHSIAVVPGTALTFLAVVVAWVFFRADTFAGAAKLLTGMISFGQWSDLGSIISGTSRVAFDFWLPTDSGEYRLLLIGLGLAIVWRAPNTAELMASLRQRIMSFNFAPVLSGAAVFWIFLLAAIGASREVAQFIYFNF
jgi:D-alanyl-lipoteichoic acid acyltransferase DltB (MBOAT superfamily)